MPSRKEGEMFYNRTGKLSQTTELDRDLAQRFMKTAAMQRSIVISDSNRRPEVNVVSVGGDTLAWRAVDPFKEAADHIGRFLNPEPLYATECSRDRFDILVHELFIDEQVRREYKDRGDYNRRFLTMLNAAVRSGVIDCLFHEKFRDPYPDYECFDLMFHFSIEYDFGLHKAEREIRLPIPKMPQPQKWLNGAVYLLRHQDNFVVLRENIDTK